jgi:hypothetical protein
MNLLTLVVPSNPQATKKYLRLKVQMTATTMALQSHHPIIETTGTEKQEQDMTNSNSITQPIVIIFTRPRTIIIPQCIIILRFIHLHVCLI